MITIKFPDTSFEVKSQLTELTLKEYEQVQSIVNKEQLDYFEKFMLVLEKLGVPMKYVESMDGDSFITFIKTFTTSEVAPNFKKKLHIEGYDYVAIEEGEDRPKFTPNTMRLIEKYITRNTESYFAEIMAVFFKREDLTIKEHFVEAHIKHKASLFRQYLSAEDALPYIYFASEYLALNIKKINEHYK